MARRPPPTTAAARRAMRRALRVRAPLLGRIWVRFGLWIAATVLLTIGILAGTMLLFAEAQYRSFEHSLPSPVRAELEQLAQNDQEDSPRAIEIYGKYWKGDLLFGEKISLLLGLAVCLPVGLVAGFWVSRTVTLPLESMAEAAQRIAQGDLAVRAEPGPGRDHGEMVEMVRHFNDMASALEAFERDRKATTASISHELRTPLTILCARLHAACDGVVVPDQQEFVNLLGQAEHLSRLVDDLHTLSMADAGRLPLRLAPLDLVALARDTLQRHALRLQQHGIQAHLVAPATAIVVDGDVDRLRQVLSNLVENATRHAHAGGWLELGVTSGRAAMAARDENDDDNGLPRSVAMLTVSDAGPGISETQRRHMFRRFGDPDRPRAPTGGGAGGGSGLGLSIVHSLVQQHDGHVAVDSSVRGGVRFTITLPLADDQAVLHAADNGAPALA